eukprot:1510217-Alexandrium_andersonii.AAC.1
MEYNLQLNGGGHLKALCSFGTAGEDRRVRLFLTRAPANDASDDHILQAVRNTLRGRHHKRPLMGW